MLEASTSERGCCGVIPDPNPGCHEILYMLLEAKFVNDFVDLQARAEGS